MQNYGFHRSAAELESAFVSKIEQLFWIIHILQTLVCIFNASFHKL